MTLAVVVSLAVSPCHDVNNNIVINDDSIIDTDSNAHSGFATSTDSEALSTSPNDVTYC